MGQHRTENLQFLLVSFQLLYASALTLALVPELRVVALEASSSLSEVINVLRQQGGTPLLIVKLLLQLPLCIFGLACGGSSSISSSSSSHCLQLVGLTRFLRVNTPLGLRRRISQISLDLHPFVKGLRFHLEVSGGTCASSCCNLVIFAAAAAASFAAPCASPMHASMLTLCAARMRSLSAFADSRADLQVISS